MLRALAGNTQGASHDATAALRRARELENPLLLVVALSAVASASIDEAPERARSALEESIAVTQSGASDVNLSLALRQLALLDLRDGNSAGALDALRAAIIHDHANGSRPGLAGTLLIGCELLNELGHADRAAVLKSALTDGALSSVSRAQFLSHTELGDAKQSPNDSPYTAIEAPAPTLTYESLTAFALDAIDTAQAALKAPNN
jgi:hypothetical protein